MLIDRNDPMPGKHGGTKIHFIAVDIFSGKRKEEIIASGDNVDQPTVVKTDFVLCDINDEGFLTLMDDGGETREDIRMPSGEHGAELAKQVLNSLHLYFARHAVHFVRYSIAKLACFSTCAFTSCCDSFEILP